MDPGARADPGVDRALRLTIAADHAETVGAILMDPLGSFEQQTVGDEAVLVFYPPAGEPPSAEDLLAVLPPDMRPPDGLRVEIRDVSRDWVDGWKDHFRPLVIGGVRVRPPWEAAVEAGAAEHTGVSEPGGAPAAASLVDVVINPGLGFGTGLHPTTRGTLQLLQDTLPAGCAAGAPGGAHAGRSRGPLVDAGTGSGILAIAAAKLGWSPVFAFDNDPAALISARENVEANGVQAVVENHGCGLDEAPLEWFAGATVLANMTLEPVMALLRRLAGALRPEGVLGEQVGGPLRVIVSGILAGAQESELLGVAGECGLVRGGHVCEAEWVSMEFLPLVEGGRAGGGPGAS